MSKKIILFTVLLLMTPALALASTARLEGLGVIPDYIEDYANIFNYPASICRYPAVVIGELGYVDGWGKGFGATMGLGQDNAYGVLGVMLRENSAFMPVPGFGGSRGSQFDITYGLNFEGVSFAARLDNSNSKLKDTNQADTGVSDSPLYYSALPDSILPNDYNSTGLGVSATLDVRDGDKIEGTFEYRTLSFKHELIGSAYSIEDQGEPSYGFWGRGFFAMSDKVTLVPVAGYNKYDYSWEIKSADPTEQATGDQTLSYLRAGLGMRVDVGSFFMLGVGASQWKINIDNTFRSPLPADVETFEYTGSSLPFLFGTFEADLRDWLTIRFGAKKNLINEEAKIEWVAGTSRDFKSTNGNITSQQRDYLYSQGIFLPYFEEPFVFSMGVGFKWNDIEIDATMNEDYPFTGMYWLSGDSETPFGKISVTYYY